MRDHRATKGETAYYTSFSDLRKSWGLKDVSVKRTKDEKKLAEQRDKFVGTCNACHGKLEYVSGTNVCVCKNEKCKGVKVGTKTDEAGNEKPIYAPYQRILDNKGFEIAQNLFD